MFYISAHSIPTILGAISAFTIGLIVLYKGKFTQTSIAFFIFCLALFGWLFGYTVVYSTKNITIAFWGTRLACAFAGFTAPAFYHLAIAYLHKEKENFFAILSYLSMFIFFLLFVTTNMCLSTPYKYFWGYYSHAVRLHPLYLVIFFGIYIRGFYLLYLGWKEKARLSSTEANRITYIFVAYFIALIGAIDYIPKYGIEIYPFGWFFEIIFALIVAYAIIRHHLMDIHIVIKKSLAYSIIIAIFTGMYMVTIYIISHLFENLFGVGSLGIATFSIFTFTLLFQPLKSKVNQIIDNFFFKGSYEYHVALKNISKKIATARNLTELNALVSEEIKDVLKVKSAKIQRFE